MPTQSLCFGVVDGEERCAASSSSTWGAPLRASAAPREATVPSTQRTSPPVHYRSFSTRSAFVCPNFSSASRGSASPRTVRCQLRGLPRVTVSAPA